MIACTDVAYREMDAFAACVLFQDWSDERTLKEIVLRTTVPEDYTPGRFFRRELPCLLSVLARVDGRLTTVIVDGYVWLDSDGLPGLGAHLYHALDKRVPVIGVAKKPFKTTTSAIPVYRGRSTRALYVSSVGIDPAEAARRIQCMQGPYRIPDLLRRVDRLSRAL